MNNKDIFEEIEKATKAAYTEKNLNQVSFYEGYVKGLKFADQYWKNKMEEAMPEKKDEEIDILLGSRAYETQQRAIQHNITIEDIKIILNKTNE